MEFHIKKPYFQVCLLHLLYFFRILELYLSYGMEEI
jgi:hypothetical protein